MTKEGFVLTTHVEDKGKLFVDCTPPVLDHMVDVDLKPLNKYDILDSQHVRKGFMQNLISSKSTLCIQPRVARKSNAKKDILTDMVFLMNAINNFAKGPPKLKPTQNTIL